MSDKYRLSPRQLSIVQNAQSGEWFAASDIASLFPEVSPATLRRDLAELTESRVLEKQGENKGVRYALTETSKLFVPYELGEYYKQDEEHRKARQDYNFLIFPALRAVELFTAEQYESMNRATSGFRERALGMSANLHQKELERFVIDFAWKSSKIEGNTYTLLDTEFLLRNGVEAEGKSKYDAKMVLNHKQAYLFAAESLHKGISIDVAYVEHIHQLVTEGLGVEQGLRNRIVGISGSEYSPLAIRQQLHEQLAVLLEAISTKRNPYEQALMALLGLSYLQPFEDGNKRTARVLANSFLLRSNCAPLSYRSVDEREYKEATLVFYEQNSVVPFRELFVEQYEYSAAHYNIAEPKG